MDVNFTCPHCEQSLAVDSSGAGETVPCPSCNREILVPLDSERETVLEPEIVPAEDNQSLANVMGAERQRLELERLRNSARLMVEEHWRQFLYLANIGEMRQAMAKLHSFDAMIKEMTATMPEPDASFMRQTIDAERQKLSDEYNRNPDALKARLGMPTSTYATPSFGHHRQDMGEMIVRTAVRATIWESVWAIFRLFR
jgi:hypothetical protein